MGPRHTRRSTRGGKRTRTIEALEDRRVMAADPLLAMLGGIEQHGIGDTGPGGGLPALVHQLERDADFWIDSRTDRDLTNLLGDVEQTLARAHSATGLVQARSEYGFLGAGQTVAIIDSGIAWDHVALGGGFGPEYRVVGGWDFTEENDAVPYDDGPSGGHGTHVAGIVGADRPGASDDGVAPGADLVSLRVFNDAGAGYFSWVENALRWVIQNRNTFANPITAVNLSLGTAWNSTSIPSWAMLEDEFAQLKAAGIFITVSAGNSFTTYNSMGLSYPAASPYVVPVMSVDSSGNLSSFSQRHPSAIGAPGRSIVSTIPDYIGNQNGIHDDYASFSGTSMAAPYVAGASVILREAMQFVGYVGITQDTIFNHMMTTATSFYDSATSQWYKRLNLAAALDVLMPADEFGSTTATAHDLGTLSGTSQIAGLIGKLSDVDYFRFTAAASGSVSFTAATTHGLAPVWTASGGSVSGSRGETYTFQAVAGQTYTIGLSTGAGIGYYTIAIDAPTAFTFTDWGAIRQAQLADQSIGGERWYRVQTTQAGYLTAEAFFTGSGSIDVAWFDANRQQLASGTSGAGSARVDHVAGQGEELYLRVRGVNADVDFRITNLVSVAGSTLSVAGTSGADVFTFTAGPQRHTLSVNGVSYQFSAASTTTVTLAGGEGRDRLTLTGSAARDMAQLAAGETMLVSSSYAVTASGFEDVIVRGGGGADVATLYDTAGDEQFTGWANRGRLVGDGFTHEVQNFSQITVHASLGSDRAVLYDSAGNDVFFAWSDRATLQGTGFYYEVRGFDRVTAHATGGFDRAVFYDSAGDDTYCAWPDRALMQGPGYHNEARGFGRTAALAITGGNDRAVFYDSAGNDSCFAWWNRVVLFGAGFYNDAQNFARTTVISSAGGSDRAIFYDSPGDDTFCAWPDRAAMYGPGFYHFVQGFSQTTAHASAGNDRALLYDSAGDDTYVAWWERAVLFGTGFYNEARGFKRAAGHSSGGNDRALFYDSAGDDFYQAWWDRATMSGTGYFNEARGFRRTVAYATAGGYDRAALYDSAGDDDVGAAVWGAYACSDCYRNEARGFHRVSVHLLNGGNDRTSIGEIDYIFSLVGQQSGALKM